MKLLILSPLFPPDTGAPAPYVKNLVPHLSGHEVTLVVYGHLPEAVDRAKIITLDKRWFKLKLLLRSFLTLLKEGRSADLVIINNGPSTELPAWAASFFFKTPITLCLSDPIATKISQSGLRKIINSLFCARVQKKVSLPEDERVFLPAERLPFAEFDEEAEKKKLDWWRKHVTELTAV